MSQYMKPEEMKQRLKEWLKNNNDDEVPFEEIWQFLQDEQYDMESLHEEFQDGLEDCCLIESFLDGINGIAEASEALFELTT